jgi:hypothetical protein
MIVVEMVRCLFFCFLPFLRSENKLPKKWRGDRKGQKKNGVVVVSGGK